LDLYLASQLSHSTVIQRTSQLLTHTTMASQVFQTKGTALITGGASGVGFAFAQLCQKFGMNVALVDKSTDGLEKAKDILSGTAKNGQRTEVYDMVCYAQ
jgi:NADP-dependent 3-hydroxy acid dehydrogenase YdfG